MPFNGSGAFSAPGASFPAVATTLIESAKYNAVISDIATGLSTCITKDGQTTVTANIPFGGNKLTGVGAATARTDAATLASIQDGTGVYVGTVAGTADAITLTPSPAITAYAVGQTFRFIASGANTGATTVAISGLTAKSVTKSGSTALAAGDIPSGFLVSITYDGTRFQINSLIENFSAFGRTLIDDASAGDARTTLGLGTIATQNANNVAITGGTMAGVTVTGGSVASLGTDIAVADGGTGASDAATARTNLGALSNAAGAVGETNLAASAVSQGKLKTALNTISVSSNTDGAAVLSGGRYCSLPSGIIISGTGPEELSWLAGGVIYDSGAGATPRAPLQDTIPTAVDFTAGYTTRGVEVTLLSYRYTGNDASNIYVQYVAACPPYNLGNGDIPMFYYGLLNNTTRNIDVLWGAEDPPFANNGPTVINPLGRIRRLMPGTLADDNGRTERIAALRRAHAMMHSNDPEDKAAVRAILDAPVTMEEKLRDMPLIPHPFASNLAGHTVVLLDPCGPVVEDLWLGETYGGDDAHKIIHSGKLIIDNTPCGAISPPGVMAVSCRWKLTQ